MRKKGNLSQQCERGLPRSCFLEKHEGERLGRSSLQLMHALQKSIVISGRLHAFLDGTRHDACINKFVALMLLL